MKFSPELLRRRIDQQLEDIEASTVPYQRFVSAEPIPEGTAPPAAHPEETPGVPAAPSVTKDSGANATDFIIDAIRHRHNDLHIDLVHQRMKIAEVAAALVDRTSAFERNLLVRVDAQSAAIEEAAKASAAQINALGATQAELRREIVELTDAVRRLSTLTAAQFDGQSVVLRDFRTVAEVGFADLASRIKSPVIPIGVDRVVMLVDNFVVSMSSHDWKMVALYAYWGTLDPGSIRLFQTLVKPGMTVVDIGANLGIYSLYASRLLAGTGSIFAFEPTPRTFELLKGNLFANGFLDDSRIHLFQCAVTDTGGTETFHIYDDNSGHNTLFARPGAQSITVPTVTLDSVLPENTRVDILKIDAEGAEPRIWRGMRRVLSENPRVVILIEFAPGHIQRAGNDPVEFLAEIRASGFEILLVDEVTCDVSPIETDELMKTTSTNILLRRA